MKKFRPYDKVLAKKPEMSLFAYGFDVKQKTHSQHILKDVEHEKDIRTLKERAEDLEKFITFKILHTLKHKYQSLDDFKKFYSKIKHGKATNEEQIHFCHDFNVDLNTYRRILGRDENSKYFKLTDALQHMNKWIHLQRNFTKQYKSSGKHFSVHSYWWIDFDVLEIWWNYENALDLNSNLYSKLQHTFVDTLYFDFTRKNTMTKKQEKQYQKEYEEGKHALTLEQYYKDQAKKKRQNDKRRMTIAKKAAKATLKDYAEMQMKIQQLEAENKYLKSLKDLNSDIVDKENEKVEYADFDKVFPDGIDPENEMQIAQLSEDCKKHLNDEAFAEKQQIEEHCKNVDNKQQIANINELLSNMHEQQKTEQPQKNSAQLSSQNIAKMIMMK